MSRKPGTIFHPEQVIDYVSNPNKERPVEELAKVYHDVSTVLVIPIIPLVHPDIFERGFQALLFGSVAQTLYFQQ